jgi:hypothetical protein
LGCVERLYSMLFSAFSDSHNNIITCGYNKYRFLISNCYAIKACRHILVYLLRTFVIYVHIFIIYGSCVDNSVYGLSKSKDVWMLWYITHFCSGDTTSRVTITPGLSHEGAPLPNNISSSFLYTTGLQQDWKRAFFIFLIPLIST